MDDDESQGATTHAASPDEAGATAPEAEVEEHPSLLDRMRGTGVGTEDPNIVGDAGPFDVAPGADPDGGGLPLDER